MPEDAPQAAIQCPTETQIPRELNDELIRELAMLNETDREFANASIGLVEFGSRLLLKQQGIITTHGDWPEIITITDRGWEVIAECAGFVERADTATWQTCRHFAEGAVAAG